MNRIGIFRPDLSAIEPRNRPEVRRRLRALAEFEASPGKRKAGELARSLGLSTAQFYNLTRAWKAMRDPLNIVGRSRPRDRGVTVHPTQSAFMDEIMRTAPDSTPDEIVRLVLRRAGQAGFVLPARETVRRYVLALRPPKLPQSLRMLGDLIVDHTVLELPVDFGDGPPRRPLATLAIDATCNAICALKLSDGPPTVGKMAGVISSAISGAPSASCAPVRSVGVPKLSSPLLQELQHTLERAGLTVGIYQEGPYERGKSAEALLGQRKEGVRLRPRLVDAGPERRSFQPNPRTPPVGLARVSVSLAEAERLAIARLGVQSGCDVPFSVGTEERSALFARLDEVARS